MNVSGYRPSISFGLSSYLRTKNIEQSRSLHKDVVEAKNKADDEHIGGPILGSIVQYADPRVPGVLIVTNRPTDEMAILDKLKEKYPDLNEHELALGDAFGQERRVIDMHDMISNTQSDNQPSDVES